MVLKQANIKRTEQKDYVDAPQSINLQYIQEYWEQEDHLLCDFQSVGQ
jgi:hypothetical protein